jgi:N-acetylglucosaminyldiphosphoundecaprenol N-acetyl-beta-D-mannosaminyltransferase
MSKTVGESHARRAESSRSRASSDEQSVNRQVTGSARSSLLDGNPPITILGVPFDSVTLARTLELIEEMIVERRSHYVVTANVDFIVQAMRDDELRKVIFDAHLVLCDGTPILWASRLLGNPLPERVAGADLVPPLLEMASLKRRRVFILGGREEVAARASREILNRYPGLGYVGYYSPPFKPLLEMDHDEMRRRVMEASPDILLVCFSCPKSEKWFAMHFRDLKVPVGIGVGATVDFLAGEIPRAPEWMRKMGLEWFFRLLMEPHRLFYRYFHGGIEFGIAFTRQWLLLRHRRKLGEGSAMELRRDCSSSIGIVTKEGGEWCRITLPETLDLDTVSKNAETWRNLIREGKNCLVDISRVTFIDSTGVGLLVGIKKQVESKQGLFLLMGVSRTVTSVLRLMKLEDFFERVATKDEADESLRAHFESQAAFWRGHDGVIHWKREVTAANVITLEREMTPWLASVLERGRPLVIDLSEVTFLDSSGLGYMIRLKRWAGQQNVSLEFRGGRGAVLNVIRINRLEKWLLEARSPHTSYIS